jgi:hypothetical protein
MSCKISLSLACGAHRLTRHRRLDLLNDFQNHAFQFDGVLAVQSFLQAADSRDMRHVAIGPVLEIEEFKARYRTVAVIDQFEDIGYLEIGQVQGNPVSGLQRRQPANQFGGRQFQEGRDIGIVAGQGVVRDFGIAFRFQIVAHGRFQIQLIHLLEPRGDPLSLRWFGGGVRLPQLPGAPPHGIEHLFLDEFGQMQRGFLPDPHEGEKRPRIDRIQLDVICAVEVLKVFAVERIQGAHHVCLLISGHFASIIHQRHHGRLFQKTQKCLGVRESSRDPDQVDVFTAKTGVEFDADADVDLHDARRFEQFGGHAGFDAVVMHHPQAPDTLDPGVHDQMGRGFATLGVGIVHVVVERDLVPRMRHLQQVIVAQLPAHVARLALCRDAKVVRQFELAPPVAARAHHLLHDLHQHPRRVLGHRPFGRFQHFGPQGAQRVQAIVHAADLKRGEQLDHGVGDAQTARFGHLLDAVRVKIAVILPADVIQILVSGADRVDDLNQFVIAAVKEEPGQAGFPAGKRWGRHGVHWRTIESGVFCAHGPTGSLLR